MKNILIYFTNKYKGNWDLIYKALEDKEQVDPVILDRIAETSKDQNIITILDSEYPNKLKEAYKPPFVLFYKGDLNLINNRLLAVTGNKSNSTTQDRIKKYVPEIEKQNTIVTADLRGCDQVISSRSKHPRVVVCAEGINVHPMSTSPENLYISEYPNGVAGTAKSYQDRHRLMAALGGSLILFSSIPHDPIHHLVNEFSELYKETYCFPGKVGEKDGNNDLIKDDVANKITHIEDLSRQDN